MRPILTVSSVPVLLLAFAAPAFAGTTWYVDGKHGKDSNNCLSSQAACRTIGHAISLASSGDSIMVAAATYMENLFIGTSLTIVGASAATTKIDGGYTTRVIAIENSSASVSLSNLTIQRGVFSGGGGILNWGTLSISNSIVASNYAASSHSAAGGAIFNYLGVLTINNTTFSKNGGTTNQVFGGAISNSGGAVTINNSTFSGNFADGNQAGGGGGIWNDGTLTINNSTFSGNKATGWGGGAIYNDSGTVAISNSTISGNGAAGSGGGIYNAATTNLQNTIVANNKTGGNCAGSAVTSNGYNLSSDGTCSFGGAGDLNRINPKLGSLANNGGLTKTEALLSGSPAIDAGNPNGCTDGQANLLTTDQRGRPRPDKEDTGGCDMGAYESQSVQ